MKNFIKFYGSIVDENENFIVKNMKGLPKALKFDQAQGRLQGGFSGLMKSYKSDLLTNVTDNNDYQLVIDPGYFFSEESQNYGADYTRTAKYYGDVW